MQLWGDSLSHLHTTETLTGKILSIVFLFTTDLLIGQLEREGTPVSWNIGENFVSHSIWKTIPALDFDALLDEDRGQEDKSVPYRFALAEDVDYSPDNSGKWSNLQNGDRIWVLGLDCQNALAVGLTFGHLELPRGGRMYIYSEDHRDFIGPFSSADNTTMPVGTPPVAGSRIIIEYYEPYAFRGYGEFSLRSVARSYRNIRDFSDSEESECFEFLDGTQFSNDVTNASSSVLMMIVENGQRIATSTLINNTSNDGTPYVMTSVNALLGLPSSWVFLFDVTRNRCFGANSNCTSSAICGAHVLETNADLGLALLKLRNEPRNNWRAYYSGWRLGTSEMSSDYICLQHSLGLPQSYVTYSGSFADGENHGLPTKVLNSSLQGSTFQGAIGSPLFDDDMNLIGMYVGGNSNCSATGDDHFVMISSNWTELDEYLDPFAFHFDRLEGLYPTTEEPGTPTKELNVFFFPNPTQERIYVQNDSEDPVSRIIIRDAGGRLVRDIHPKVPTVDLENLPMGFYTITFIVGNQVSNQSLLIR